MEKTPDHKLIEWAQNGDKQAFGILVERYMRRAYYVALGLVGCHEDALDLSQDAFVRAYKAINRFDRERAFFTWFYQILRNLCFNFIRDHKKREYAFSEICDGDLFQIQDEDQLPPDRLLEKKELSRRMWKSIQSLPETEREVIILREFQDMSYQEITQVVECPLGTVMSRLYSARKHLARDLKDDLT